MTKKDMDKTALALKYPDYHTWRDLDEAMENGGYWPNGEMVRISDPEMRPEMDALLEEMKANPEKTRNFLQNLALHKPSEA